MADSYSFQIDRFKNKFRLGGARPNLFRVTIDMMASGVAGASDKIMFTCRATSVPAATLGTIEVPYFGRKVKVAGDRTYAEWTVTVLNDEDYIVRNAFESWNYGINTPNANLRDSQFYNIDEVNLFSSYKRHAGIVSYDKKGEIIASYELHGCYPSEVGPLDKAWDTNDTIEEYTVTFQFDYVTRGIGEPNLVA